ncbi:hypothetical protein JTB14_029070 [Gonioctena quinquepunctata]|nr:hypothetical protein JTB14_029070 [Gonioctena quinquepunctata]
MHMPYDTSGGSNACTKLSNSKICANVSIMFGEAQNSAAFKEFQTFHEVKPHKILRASQTRWLSLQASSKNFRTVGSIDELLENIKL